jgi:methyl-accepting chemotaxis protein
MQAAQSEVAATVRQFSAEGEQLARGIRSQQDDFGALYNILTSYSEHFQSIFSSVNRLIADIDVHIKRFNPLFQLHEVSVQEMENLNKIISDFLNEQRGQMTALIEGLSDESRHANLAKLIRDFEKKTISRFELQVLRKIVERYDFGSEMELAKATDEIEIF